MDEQARTPLTGTDKQIAWAEQIRTKFFRDLDTLRAQLEAGKQPGYSPRFNAIYFEELETIRTQAEGMQTSAWWINNGLKRSPEPLLAARIRARQARKA